MGSSGAGSDIIICSEGQLMRYWVSASSTPTGGVLVDGGTCSQAAGFSQMSFTRDTAAGANEREIFTTAGELTTFIWARGNDGTTALAYHAARGSINVDLASGKQLFLYVYYVYLYLCVCVFVYVCVCVCVVTHVTQFFSLQVLHHLT